MTPLPLCQWVIICSLFLFLGEDSGKIIIWNMAPVKDEAAEKDENVPKVLCEMDNHLGENLAHIE